MENKIENYQQIPVQELDLPNISSSSKGGLCKIKDAEQPCLYSGHNPPMHIYLTAGTYEYTCPSCDKITTFTVPSITV